MIPSAWVWMASLMLAAPVDRNPPPSVDPSPPPPDVLEPLRTPFEVLSERMIGTASRPVRYDWRRMTLGAGVTFGQLLELNNFISSRVGGQVRLPVGPLLAEVETVWVATSGSESTDKLALTPYRQAGRPSRLELGVTAALPLVEGVGTPRIGLLPNAELVMSVAVGFRYLFYPTGFGGMGFRELMGQLFSPGLGDKEVGNLDPVRLPGMELDRGRYNVLVGATADVYLRSGFFLSPRVLLNLPLLNGASGSKLGFWWELEVSAGWCF